MSINYQHMATSYINDPEFTIQDVSHHAPILSAWIPPYIDYLRVEKTRRPLTLERYAGYLRTFVQAVGDGPMSTITSEHILRYKRRMLDAGLSPASMATRLTAVRGFLRYTRDVCSVSTYDPEKILRPKVPQREVDYLTKDELAKFLDAIPVHTRSGLRHRALAEILSASGMRISEAISLNREHIDWETRDARIIGKGQKVRRVYFTERSLQWLARYLDIRDDKHPAVFVVLHEDAPKRLSAQGIWKVFRLYAKRAGLTKRVYPHMLRHTLATTLLVNGCPIGHIRAILGHAHLVTTCKYYLGTVAQAEVKSAHQKFLFYTSQEVQANREGGEESDELSTR